MGVAVRFEVRPGALLEGIQRRNATVGEMAHAAKGGKLRGIYQMSGRIERVNAVAVDLFFPRLGSEQSPSQRRVNEGLHALARHTERFLKMVT